MNRLMTRRTSTSAPQSHSQHLNNPKKKKITVILRPHWSGFRASEISFSTTGSVWQLKDRESNKVFPAGSNNSILRHLFLTPSKVLASVFAKLWPVGRHQWFIQVQPAWQVLKTNSIYFVNCHPTIRKDKLEFSHVCRRGSVGPTITRGTSRSAGN